MQEKIVSPTPAIPALQDLPAILRFNRPKQQAAELNAWVCNEFNAGKSLAQIAAELGRPEVSVSRRLARAGALDIALHEAYMAYVTEAADSLPDAEILPVLNAVLPAAARSPIPAFFLALRAMVPKHAELIYRAAMDRKWMKQKTVQGEEFYQRIA